MRPLYCTALVLFFCFSPLTVSQAQEARDQFYVGKTISIIVGSTAGGGYDFNARVLARHLGKQIPGTPSVIVQNMPGAGSLAAANHVYNVAQQDGTVIGSVQRTIPFEPFFEEKGVRFDVRKIHWIGSTTSEIGVVVAWHTSPHKTASDLLTTEMVVGGNGPATDTELFARVMNRLLGTKFKIVAGYPGESQIILAMERNEIQGVANWSWNNIPAKHPDWLRDKKIRILLQLGVEKHPDLPDVPLIMDLARTPDERKMFEVLMQMKILGRPFLLAPEVPTDRVKLIRAAFSETMKDSGFQNEMTKSGISIDPVSGEDMQKALFDIYSLPPTLIKEIRAAVAH